MKSDERQDDFDSRREHLAPMSDEELHARFWNLVQTIVAPLIEEARTHTSPSIERSVLLRMGFSSTEAKVLVDGMIERDLLAHGAGRLILALAKSKGIVPTEAGAALIEGRFWDELAQ